MAKQNLHPGTWFDRLSDGCSGVFDFEWVNKWIRRACLIHDCDSWWGGSTAEEKAQADLCLRDNTARGGWLGRRLAPGRHWGVRRFTWNTPPRKASLTGPPGRRYDTMFQALKHGQTRIETWNWLGPGRGEHANMEAQGSKALLQLLPEQMTPKSPVV